MSAFNTEWLTPENQITAAPVINWPYQLDKAVCHDPVAGCLRFTKQFEDHVCEPTNWTFSKRALEVFPTLGEHGAIFALRPGEEWIPACTAWVEGRKQNDMGLFIKAHENESQRPVLTRCFLEEEEN